MESEANFLAKCLVLSEDDEITPGTFMIADTDALSLLRILFEICESSQALFFLFLFLLEHTVYIRAFKINVQNPIVNSVLLVDIHYVNFNLALLYVLLTGSLISN